MHKFLIARVNAAEGVGTDDYQVQFYVTEITEPKLRKLLHLMKQVPVIGQQLGEPVDLITIREVGTFYAIDYDKDTDDVSSGLLGDEDFVVVDELPTWWDEFTVEVRSDADYMDVGQSSVTFTANEHYGDDRMSTPTIWNTEVEQILRDHFQSNAEPEAPGNVTAASCPECNRPLTTDQDGAYCEFCSGENDSGTPAVEMEAR